MTLGLSFDVGINAVFIIIIITTIILFVLSIFYFFIDNRTITNKVRMIFKNILLRFKSMIVKNTNTSISYD